MLSISVKIMNRRAEKVNREGLASSHHHCLFWLVHNFSPVSTAPSLSDLVWLFQKQTANTISLVFQFWLFRKHTVNTISQCFGFDCCSIFPRHELCGNRACTILMGTTEFACSHESLLMTMTALSFFVLLSFFRLFGSLPFLFFYLIVRPFWFWCDS